MDSGATAWLLTSSALVLFMTPGLALFYGGMVRARNALAMLMNNFVAMGIVTVTWIVIGYTLAFGPSVEGWGLIGGLDYIGLEKVGSGNPIHGAAVPDSLFMAFQMMFAIITPALISGAIAGRMKLSAWMIFIAVWSVIVYAPMAHWVWAGGIVGGDLGAIDFAGGLVVHINAGAAALAAALVLGPRLGFGRDLMRPHALPLTLLGTGILWFGWFGFNAGSAIAADGAAANAFVTTQVAAAVAATTWIVVEWLTAGKPTTLGVASGAVAGLVAITPAAGFVGPLAAILIGIAAGAICYWALRLKFRYGFDDSLDVVAVHLVGGIVGSILLGILADADIGGVAGGFEQLLRQAASVLIAVVYSFVVSYLLLRIIQKTIGLRVTEEEERRGLDLSLHDEQAYVLSD
ncbi:MAG: ammonium transporter [Chloroflexi bacterium]|nr:ammonium transporter [Chloroflexota bacterium]